MGGPPPLHREATGNQIVSYCCIRLPGMMTSHRVARLRPRGCFQEHSARGAKGTPGGVGAFASHLLRHR